MPPAAVKFLPIRRPLPRSPVRTRTASVTGMTKSLPSPMFPVRAASQMILITASTFWSETTTSTLTFVGFAAATLVDDAALNAAPGHVDDVHPVEAGVGQRVLDVVQLLRPDYRFNLLHL